jgi:aconitate hydratase
MGVLPLLFRPGEGARELGLTGRERFTFTLPEDGELRVGGVIQVRAVADDGSERRFEVTTALHSAIELEYYRAGGVLPYVLKHRFAG